MSAQGNGIGSADRFKDLVCDIAAEETNDQLRRFVSAAHPSPDKSVLVDIGCGIGTFVQKFGDRFNRIFAADFATSAIRQAESAYRGTTPVEWRVADLNECPKLFGTKLRRSHRLSQCHHLAERGTAQVALGNCLSVP